MKYLMTVAAMLLPCVAMAQNCNDTKDAKERLAYVFNLTPDQITLDKVEEKTIQGHSACMGVLDTPRFTTVSVWVNKDGKAIVVMPYTKEFFVVK